MAQSVDKVDRRLREAMTSGTPVTIRRGRLEGSQDLDGLVDQVTSNWVVLAGLDDAVYPDGFEIIRRRDISKVITVSTARAAYIGRSLGSLGRHQTVCPFTLPELATTRELLEVVAADTGILGFHVEDDDPDILFIGRISAFRNKSFDLLFVDPDGRWDDATRRWTYKQVSRITIEDRYQRALEKFGDPFPTTFD